MHLIPHHARSLDKCRADIRRYARRVQPFTGQRQASHRVGQRTDQATVQRAQPVDVVFPNRQPKADGARLRVEELDGRGSEAGRVVPACREKGICDALHEAVAGCGR